MIDLSNVPSAVVIQNKSSIETKIGVSGYNQSFILPAEEAIKVKVENSSEYIGYLSQVNKTLDVSDAATTIVASVKIIPGSTAKEIMDEKAESNQLACVLIRDGNTFKIKGDLAKLYSWQSSVAEQGIHKWLAVDVNTGESAITSVTYNGSALTSSDVTDATTWGLPAGHFILWLKCDEIVSTPKSIVLGVSGKTSETLTFVFENN